MGEAPQFDPSLKQLLLRETGSTLGEGISDAAGAKVVPVIARLVDPGVPVPGLEVVSRFGPVVTARVRLDRVVRVRQDPNVASLKASTMFGADLDASTAEIGATRGALAARLGPHAPTGRGVVIGFADWGCDFAHANLRNPDGTTRLRCLWDQRGGASEASPAPFGYGRLHVREAIDAALAAPDPYGALGYDPADADTDGSGTHCTHVMDIAAGNGRAPGAVPGVAPEADLVCVHLRAEDTRPEDTLGDSVRVLEAVQFIVEQAGASPVVINLSLGKTGGPHDASPLLVQALDDLVAAAPGRQVVQSAGNYYSANLHASGRVPAGGIAELRWHVVTSQRSCEMEIWYPAGDRLTVELVDPAGHRLARVPLGEDCLVRDGEMMVASIFHRRRDPNNGDNQIDIFLWPAAPSGVWTARLIGEAVTDGRFHAWIERTHASIQARFDAASADPRYSHGTICGGRRTIAVGAYDARSPQRELGAFSSAGPTRDGRTVPLVLAPGVGVRAARSSLPTPYGRLRDGLTVKSGSSMAAPHVSGLVALMFEVAGERRLSAAEVRTILAETARPATDGDACRYGAGRVDVPAAVARVRARGARSEDPAGARVAQESTILETEMPVVAEDGQAGDTSSAHSCGESDHADAAETRLDPLQARLAAILPQRLVAFGDRELARLGPSGLPVYDRREPLVFAPANRVQPRSGSRYAYHAANFVFNTAYALGYRVPVYPPESATPEAGRAYLNLAATFDALAGPPGALRDYLLRFLHVVASPGEPGPVALSPGDLLLRGALAEAAFGHLAIVVDPLVRRLDDPFFREVETTAGGGVHGISAGLLLRGRAARYGHALTDGQGFVLERRMVLRFRPDAIDVARVRERLSGDDDFRREIETAHWLHETVHGGGILREDELAEATPDGAAAVPPFAVAKRSEIATPLLDAAKNAAAAAWNTAKHPADSGIAPDELLAALANYVDLAAVASAMTTAGFTAPGADAVCAEAIHQFQKKCFVDSRQHDGKAGESVLDSLGFVSRRGLHTVDQVNTNAQGRLTRSATAIAAAAGGGITAGNWFEHMMNPSFLGRRFGNGVHVVLVRKLRIAESHLLSQPGYRGMTPVELGHALGLTQDHGGARPNAAGGGMHSFGLAADIEYTGNPWIAGQHVERDKQTRQPTAAGERTLVANREFIAAANRAALLVSGVTVDLTAAFLDGLRSRTTGDVYDVLASRNGDLKAYLTAADDLDAIRRHLAARRAAGTAGVVNPGESTDAAAARWRAAIRADLARLRAADSNFAPGRDPTRGFLNLHRDLVIALRDAAGLAWGAVDFGASESGDVMHFDCRRDGVGRVANASR